MSSACKTGQCPIKSGRMVNAILAFGGAESDVERYVNDQQTPNQAEEQPKPAPSQQE